MKNLIFEKKQLTGIFSELPNMLLTKARKPKAAPMKILKSIGNHCSRKTGSKLTESEEPTKPNSNIQISKITVYPTGNINILPK